MLMLPEDFQPTISPPTAFAKSFTPPTPALPHKGGGSLSEQWVTDL
jgi:hypothetical protein